MCLAIRMRGDLHRAKIIRPEAYEACCIQMTAYNEVLHFRVSTLSETAMGHTLPHGCLTI